MRSKLFQITTLIAFSMWLIPATGLAFAQPVARSQGGSSDDQKYAGTWAGTYTTTGGATNSFSYILRKDDKGQWGGSLKYINQEGEQVATFSSVQIADGKLKARFEAPGGEVEVTLDGQFQGDRIEGTYTVKLAGSTDVVDSGTWKLTKNAAAKTGQ